MSRRIDTGAPQPPQNAKKPLNLGNDTGGGEDYLGRLAKYIPAEIVGLYLATSSAIPKANDGSPRWQAMWIVFAINFVFVPAYFFFATTRNDNKPLWSQIVLASIAFPVWVFAIGGPFRWFGWYEGWIASITLAFVTVAFGFYKPPPGS